MTNPLCKTHKVLHIMVSVDFPIRGRCVCLATHYLAGRTDLRQSDVGVGFQRKEPHHGCFRVILYAIDLDERTVDRRYEMLFDSMYVLGVVTTDILDNVLVNLGI